MTDEPRELVEYKTDHDLLIELRVVMNMMRSDIREIKHGTSGTLTGHETRIRSLEESRSANEGRSGAISWIGGVTYSVLALVAGLVGSLIQAGRF